MIIDDILIAGRHREHHNQILKKVVTRATEYYLKLNFDKSRVERKTIVSQMVVFPQT